MDGALARSESVDWFVGLGQQPASEHRSPIVQDGQQAHYGLPSIAAWQSASVAGRWGLLQQEQQGLVLWIQAAPIVNQHALMVGAILTPANTDDRHAAPALAWATEGGLCLADWGYRGEEGQGLLLEEDDLLLLTTNAVGAKRALVCSLRELRRLSRNCGIGLWIASSRVRRTVCGRRSN